MRLNFFIAIFLIFLFSISPNNCYCEDWGPWDSWQPKSRLATDVMEISKLDIIEKPFILMLIGYKKYISPVYGGHCVMYPSCSQYSVEAITRKGAILGIIMTAARLMHEADEPKLSPVRLISGKFRYLDPVE